MAYTNLDALLDALADSGHLFTPSLCVQALNRLQYLQHSQKLSPQNRAYLIEEEIVQNLLEATKAAVPDMTQEDIADVFRSTSQLSAAVEDDPGLLQLQRTLLAAIACLPSAAAAAPARDSGSASGARPPPWMLLQLLVALKKADHLRADSEAYSAACCAIAQHAEASLQTFEMDELVSLITITASLEHDFPHSLLSAACVALSPRMDGLATFGELSWLAVAIARHKWKGMPLRPSVLAALCGRMGAVLEAAPPGDPLPRNVLEQVLWAFARLRVRDRRLVRTMVAAAVPHLPEIGSRQLVSVLMLIGQAGEEVPLSSMQLIIERARQCVSDWRAASYKHVMWALGKKRLACESNPELKALADAVLEKMAEDRVRPGDAGILIWAFGCIRYPCTDGDALNTFIHRQATSGAVDGVNHVVLPQLLNGLAELDVRDEAMMTAAADRCLTLLPDLTDHGLSNALLAFGRLNTISVPLLRAVAIKVADRPMRDIRDCSDILSACARLQGHGAPDVDKHLKAVVAALGPQAMAALENKPAAVVLSNRQLATLAWAAASLEHPGYWTRPEAAAMVHAVLRRARPDSMNLLDLSNVLCAAGSLGLEVDPRCISALNARVLALATPDMEPALAPTLAMMLVAHAKLQGPPYVHVIAALVAAVSAHINVMAPSPLCSCMWALGKLGFDPGQDFVAAVVSGISGGGEETLRESLGHDDWSGAVWGTARLGLDCGALLDTLVGALPAAAPLHDWPASSVANLIWALGVEGRFEHPAYALALEAINRLASGGPELPRECVRQVLQAHLLAVGSGHDRFDLSAALRENARSVWEQAAAAQASPLVVDISKVLSRLGVRSRVGSKTPDGLFQIDVALNRGRGKAAIEVLGPHHVTINTQRSMGRTRFREQALRQLYDYSLIRITSAEWYALGNSASAKTAFLSSRIEELDKDVRERTSATGYSRDEDSIQREPPVLLQDSAAP